MLDGRSGEAITGFKVSHPTPLRARGVSNLSVLWQLELVQHAKLVALLGNAALGDLLVRTVLNGGKSLVNLSSLQLAGSLLHSRQGSKVTHAARVSRTAHFAGEDCRVRNAFYVEMEHVRLSLARAARSTWQGPDLPACHAAPRKSAALAKDLRVYHVLFVELKSDIPAESSWNAVLEKAPVQPAESPLHEESYSSPSSYTSTLAAIDTRRAFHDESEGVTTPLSKTSCLTAPSELGRTPSPDVSSSDSAVGPSSLAGCASYEQLLDVLPNRELCCVIDAISFEAEYEAFCRNFNVAPQSWLSLLFAILALACRAEEDSGRGCFSDDLSMRCEEAAWHCLLTNDPPFEISRSSLKAMVLIIYGRTHRGEDVFSDLQLACRAAISTKCHVDTEQCVVQPKVCEEYRCILVSLKALFMLNAQMHDYYRNPVLTQEYPEHSSLSTGAAELSPMETTFTMLNSQLLKISDTICVSAERGLMSECTLAVLETELDRMEKACSELNTKLGGPGSQSISHQGGYGILHCYINYLLRLLFLPYLQRYLDGETTPETRLSALKCIAFAKATLRVFNLLAESMQSKSYAWYMRGLGSYYAEQSAYTLIGGAAGLQGGKEDQEVESLLNPYSLQEERLFSNTDDRM
ncbi:hypothetical protein N7508_007370 [Penicillium antarcticum]|uniref:uncharacterized protein n=1 Tax=Penicillium antarcticum TaxID=416450 RepID=UPI0023A0F5CB|nr:uncharacterized protein N7508_007370 [Penicillium antarcticum]KAJ5300127.1 hypothetical protein N7508_007370 [Penicillium antarcticum]